MLVMIRPLSKKGTINSYTVIRNFNNRRIVIPNSMISDQSIINADLIEQKICQWIEIGISYASDVDKAKRLLQEEVEKHPLLIDNRSEEDIANGIPKVMVRVTELGNFSVNLRAWAWAKDQADAFVLRCDLLESLKKRFDAEGIEIPYPYQNVVLKEKSE